MILKKSKKLSKSGNESHKIRDKRESTFESIDEKDEDYLYNNNSKKISSEENNVRTSVDSEKLKVEKKVRRGKKKKAKDKQQEEIDKALIQYEKNNKQKILKGELANIIEEIEKENKDFKKKVFFSNFHDLNNHLGIFDEVKDNNNRELIYEGLKDKNNSPYGLIDKYKERADYLRKNKKKK